jgi:hypothetical protein
MEVLYFIIFGGLLAFFIGYAIWMHHKDKKILKEWEDQEKKSSSEIPSQTQTRVLGWCDLSEEELGIQYSEHPFIDGYQILN